MRRCIIATLVLCFCLYVPMQSAHAAEFTYQGKLTDGGGPANGNYNIDVELWDAANAGSQIGATLNFASVAVADGLFTLQLDFGVNAFDNSDRWLRIIVNGTALTPRQPITRAPYSIQTRGIFVNDAGSVGIGTTTPQADLHIDSSGSSADGFRIHAPGASTGDVVITSPAGEVGIAGFSNNGHRQDIRFTNSGVGIFTNFTSSPPVAGHGLFIDDDGKVGIGTTQTSGDLTIADGFPTIVLKDDSGLANGQLRFTDSGEATLALLQAGNGVFEMYSPVTPVRLRALLDEIRLDGELVIIEGGDDASLSGGGFVQIGDGSNTMLLDDNEIMARTNGTDAGVLSLNNDGGNVLINATNSAGRVGIKVGNPDFDLHVNGTAGKPGGGSWSVASDLRLKEDIQPIDSALETLLSLRGIAFHYKDPESIHELPGQRIGMIAQEVESVFPDWVDVRDDGFKAVTYRGFEALAVEALRELRDEKDAQIDRLHAENESLRADVEQLKVLMHQLVTVGAEDSE